MKRRKGEGNINKESIKNKEKEKSKIKCVE